jgi:hypothetical protein
MKLNCCSWIIIIIVILGIFLIISSVIDNKKESSQNKTGVNQEKNNELQKADFITMYNQINTEVYNSRSMAYYAVNTITKVSSSNAYNLLKDNEEAQRKCSLYFTYSSFSMPDSLKEYQKDIEQSLNELSNACSILQTYSKNMAEYINTNDLKYSRNSSEALEQEPTKLESNAMSRLIYGIGEKIGIDVEKLKSEYENMNNQIEQGYNDFLKSRGL